MASKLSGGSDAGEEDGNAERPAEYFKKLIDDHEQMMKIAVDYGNASDIGKFTELIDEARHRITDTKPLPEQMNIFTASIAKLERSLQSKRMSLPRSKAIMSSR